MKILVRLEMTFEIHVLVDPKQEEGLLQASASIHEKHPALHSCKVMATLTSTGVSPRQPMISGFYSATDAADAVSFSHSVAKSVEDCGFTVTRIKVEQLISLSDPVLDEVQGDAYYEAHVKVGSSMPNPDRYRLLAEICLKYGAQLLINPYSIKMAPVTTMRMYDTSVASFASKHQAFLKDLDSHGFTTYKQHLEMGVHDTNVYTDVGWLFHGSEYKVPITEVDCPARVMAPELVAHM